MRHTCEHCAASYEIPVAKVAGRFLKVRCSRCQRAMHVVGLREFDAYGSDGACWWAAIGQAPRGPYREDEVCDLVAGGDIHARTRMWRSGMNGWERVCESTMLAWVYDEVLARAASAEDVENAFTRAALLSDGHGYFPDPTLKSGIILLDDDAQRALEKLAARAQKKRTMRGAMGTHAWPSMFAPIAAALFGAASAAAGIAWFIAQQA